METRKQPGKKSRRKYGKHGISGNMPNYVKKRKMLEKIRGNQAIEVIETDVELNREKWSETGKPQVEAVVKRLYNDRVEEAKAIIAKNESREHERRNTWLQKHMDKFKAAGDELEQISDTTITLERRVKAVQAAAEKRMIAL